MNKKVFLVSLVAALAASAVVGYKLATAEQKEKKYRKLTEALDEEDELEPVVLDLDKEEL